MSKNCLKLRIEDLSSESWYLKNAKSVMDLLSNCSENKASIKFTVGTNDVIKIEVSNKKVKDLSIEGTYSICEHKKIVKANANNNLFLPFFTNFKSIVIPHNRFYTYGFKDKTLITFVLRNIFSSLALNHKINLVEVVGDISTTFSEVFNKFYYWHVKKYLLVNKKNVDMELVYANFYIDVIKFDNPLWESSAQQIKKISSDTGYLPSDSYVSQLLDLRNDIVTHCYP